jgi:hypothetical protein
MSMTVQASLDDLEHVLRRSAESIDRERRLP